METWTVRKILDWGIDFFKKKDVPRPRLSAELLLAAVLGLTRMNLYLDHDRILKPLELATYKKYILKRLEHVPIQYILGEAHFRNITLYVDRNVLIPRPETELLVDKALEESRRFLEEKVLKVGTGSGAIALSLYTELLGISPDYAGRIKITATDLSAEAINISRKNAANILAGCTGGDIKFINCDILPADNHGWMSENKGKMDLVISNPPYISKNDFLDLPQEIRQYEPREALVAGETGLESYEKILSKIKGVINNDLSVIIFETDPITGRRLLSLVKKYIEVENIYLEKDYNQKERILIAYS